MPRRPAADAADREQDEQREPEQDDRDSGGARDVVASVYIFGQIESDNVTGAAAVSVVLLVASLGVLLAIGGVRRWATRHDL